MMLIVIFIVIIIFIFVVVVFVIFAQQADLSLDAHVRRYVFLRCGSLINSFIKEIKYDNKIKNLVFY